MLRFASYGQLSRDGTLEVHTCRLFVAIRWLPKPPLD